MDGLLDTLLDAPDAQRPALLRSLQATHPALATRLARMLSLAQEEAPTLVPGGALQTAVVDEMFAEGGPSHAIGERFCGFRLDALIGRGGMSDVYRASREYDGFTATVALKLIHRDRRRVMHADELRHEQRALARLDHPGIARFIDAGEAPSGEIWLAMEYVDGERILPHADRKSLDIRSRVGLLVDLCRALEHAHARRLVHGDVKSANVLVDGEERLRLVDFGIASDASLGEDARPRAFTPECAAPEQIAGREITTATDVFQVGALAYRLLSGISRLHGEGSDGRGSEVHEQLLAPSEALKRASVELSGRCAAQRGHAHGRQLSRALRGDLDAIVLRCLQAEAEHRYANCLQLREDLEAWLSGRVVRARPGGAARRIGKYLRRHVRAAAAITLVAAVALVGGIASLVRLRQAEIARLAEADRAIQVERFLSQTFRAASPYLRDDNTDPIATVAAFGANLLRDDSGLDLRTRARLGLSLAQLQLARGDAEQAGKLLDSAANALRDTRTSGAEELRVELFSAMARSNLEADRLDEAIDYQRAAVTILADEPSTPPLQLALAQGQMGDLLRRAGRLEEAAKEFAQAMPGVMDDFTQAGPDRVRVVDGYVRYLSQAGRVGELRRLRTAVQARADRPPASSVGGVESSSILAEIESLLTGPAAAAPLYEKAAARFRSLLGEQHPRVARALVDACVSRLESGSMSVARQLCANGLEIYRKSGGEDSLNVAIAMLNLAVISYNTGELLEADDYAARSVDLLERNDQPFAQLHGQLLQGRIAIAHGRTTEALTHLDRAAATRRRALPENETLELEIDQLRAFALVSLGRSTEAAGVISGVMPILGRLLPADRARNRAWTEVARAQVAAARRDGRAVRAAVEAALKEYRATPGRNDLEQGWLHAELALAMMSLGDRANSLELADIALASLSPRSAGAHWANAWAIRRLSGGAADKARDSTAKAVLEAQDVETPQAIAYLAMR